MTIPKILKLKSIGHHCRRSFGSLRSYFTSPGLEIINPNLNPEDENISQTSYLGRNANSNKEKSSNHFRNDLSKNQMNSIETDISMENTFNNPINTNISNFLIQTSNESGEIHLVHFEDFTNNDNTDFLLAVAQASPTHGFTALKQHQLFSHHRFISFGNEEI